MDEPALVLDLDDDVCAAFQPTYQRLYDASPELSLLVATYFGDLGANLETACRLPVAGLHIDVVYGRNQLDAVLAAIADSKYLSLGAINGRNIWRADVDAALAVARLAQERIGNDRLLVAPSCSLLHCPMDLDLETSLDSELRRGLRSQSRSSAKSR